MPRPAPVDARARLVDLIGESVYHALALKESLEEERKALEAQDMEALQAALDSKSACVTKLKGLDGERIELCQAWGFEDGPEQMQELIEWCDDDGHVSRRWEHLMVLAAEGSALNMTNGAIIRLRQQQFESSLSVLRGSTPRSTTYGRDGEAAGDFGRNSLAEA